MIADVNCSAAGTVARRRATARSGRGRSTAETVSVSNTYANALLDLRRRSIGRGLACSDHRADVRLHRVPVLERAKQRQETTRPPRDRQIGTVVPDRTQFGDGSTVTQDHRPLTVLGRFEETAKVPLGESHWQAVLLCHTRRVCHECKFCHHRGLPEH